MLLVLSCSQENIVCQCVNTGKIRSFRREQFNRGRTGFTLLGPASVLGTQKRDLLLQVLTTGHQSQLKTVITN
jgi:hypothetical protein